MDAVIIFILFTTLELKLEVKETKIYAKMKL